MVLRRLRHGRTIHCNRTASRAQALASSAGGMSECLDKGMRAPPAQPLRHGAQLDCQISSRPSSLVLVPRIHSPNCPEGLAGSTRLRDSGSPPRRDHRRHWGFPASMTRPPPWGTAFNALQTATAEAAVYANASLPSPGFVSGAAVEDGWTGAAPRAPLFVVASPWPSRTKLTSRVVARSSVKPPKKASC
jgi:hypothetical protein